MCKPLPLNNGGEFTGHQEVSRSLKCDIYFAKPYCSWQRGLNENTNGSLRRFFPKGMKISTVSNRDIWKAQLLINTRPRKNIKLSQSL
ncbi:IS30 family transposase [Vibrio profundum]